MCTLHVSILRSGLNINTDIDRERHPICFYSLRSLIDTVGGNMQAHVNVFPSHMEPVGALLSHSAVWRMIEVGVMKSLLSGTVAVD